MYTKGGSEVPWIPRHPKETVYQIGTPLWLHCGLLLVYRGLASRVGQVFNWPGLLCR